MLRKKLGNSKSEELIFAEYLHEKRDFVDTLPVIGPSVIRASKQLIRSFTVGGKLLICGNGGSASDSNHIATEFVNGLGPKLKYPLPAISLSADNSIITSCGNDFDFSQIFGAQVLALAQENDCIMALSTSGNSKNILYALEVAKTMRLGSVVLTGSNPNPRIFDLSENVVCLPSNDTQSIQEGSMIVYHYICRYVIEHFRSESVNG